MQSIGKRIGSGLMVALAGLLPLLGLFFTIHATSDRGAPELPVQLVSDAPPPFALEAVTEDVLWLARCIYSETKREEEQELVAWVIRNRVETEYRGQNTYHDVVLDPYQFSAFNPGNPKRRLYTSLAATPESPAFVRALEVAHAVYHAPAAARPFPERTRHFYSERSMVGVSKPNWAHGHTPVQPTSFRPDPRRFRFYAGVAAPMPVLSVRF